MPTTWNFIQLGAHVETPGSPDKAVLENRAVQARRRTARDRALHLPGIHLALPVTGQPDFIVIHYAPDEALVGSKSLKLFRTSFRNHALHEECTVLIGRRIVGAIKLRVGGYWYPRGGIPIDAFWQTGAPPGGRLVARYRRGALSRARLSNPKERQPLVSSARAAIS